MRFAFVLAATLLVPAAAGSESCEPERTVVEPAPDVSGSPLRVVIEESECDEGRVLLVDATDPSGRTTIEWYDDERGEGIELFRPPYFATWTQTSEGCSTLVYVFGFGATELGCAAGPPPERPELLP